MPDHNGATIRGRAGRLLWGSRVVTEFERWTARTVGPSSLEVQVERHTPDPVWWQFCGDDLAAELDLGRAPLRGSAAGLCRDTLRFTLEES